MGKKLTTETFKIQLEKEHPNLELLSEYNGNKNYITVRCKIHNYVFNTKPNWLHKGQGCQKCYDEKRGETTRKKIEDFIKEANLIHKNKYDYSNVVYKNNKAKICIICPIHGEFWQTPNKHLSGQGCPKCSGKNKTTEEIIDIFNKIHKNYYNYNKVEYKNNKAKICIICPIHGEFWQTPEKHIQGEGCPLCKSSKLEMTVRNFLLDNNIDFIRQAKFNWLGKQSLDFYLPIYNIAIECQGEQHFKEFSGKFKLKNTLDKRIQLDITKNDLCNKNGIKIFYFFNRKWEHKSLDKIFNNIYNSNVIFENEINKLKDILS